MQLDKKLLELCKTRTTKSSFDMFNFYVVFAGKDLVTDADRATTWRCNFKSTSLSKKSTKKEGHSDNMGSNEKTIWRIQTKKKHS